MENRDKQIILNRRISDGLESEWNRSKTQVKEYSDKDIEQAEHASVTGECENLCFFSLYSALL